MCGFIFQYQKGKDSHELNQLAEKALQNIKHRGPDDQGIWCQPPCIIGHRRLSIIDIETSKQPMSDNSSRYILAYNGEIYNYKELRKNLKNKWLFRTNGDTEVLLAGLIIYGDSFLEKMEGMWAFAFWNEIEKQLFLARDRMGKKPLFYQYSKNFFSCSSSLNALSILSPYTWSEDINSTADYFRYGFFLPGTTAYENVHEVLPGNFLRWSPKTVIKQTRYWSLSIGNFNKSKKYACDYLRETLIQSVRKRLIADVEVGAFLSGGIDSSLIVAIIAKKIGIAPKTFTIGFTESSFDESRYAKIISDLYATEHFERHFEDLDHEQLLSLILKHMGQPFSDSSLLPTAMLSDLASEKVKVVLSGDGGDEFFSGYQRYQARVLLQWYTRLPEFFRRNISRTIRLFPEPVVHHSHSLIKKANLFLDIANQQQSKIPYVAPLLYSQTDLMKLTPEFYEKGHSPQTLPLETEENSFIEMMAADSLIYLPQDILCKLDRASMAHSLEARAPFLDTKIIELAFSLPSTWHRKGIKGKKILRDSFNDLLPQKIWNRRKKGFNIPIYKWFMCKNVESQIMELLNNSKTPLKTSYIKQMLQTHLNGKRDFGHKLWNIYVYLQWQKNNNG